MLRINSLSCLFEMFEMKSLELKKIYERLRPVLEEYLKEKTEIEKQVKQQGTVPLAICSLCKKRRILSVAKFREDANKTIPEFLEWLRSNEVRRLWIEKETIHVESRKEALEGKKSTLASLNIIMTGAPFSYYEFTFNKSEFKKKTFSRLFDIEFSDFGLCSHLAEDALQKEALPVILVVKSIHPSYGPSSVSAEHVWAREQGKNELKLLCKECYERIGSLGCEEGVMKRGFVYETLRCSFRKILFQSMLAKYNIKFVTSESDIWFPESFDFHLPELNVFVTERTRDIKEQIEKLKPNCILSFGKRGNIVNFLGYDMNVILFDDSEDAIQRFFLFDKERKVEDSLERIVTAVMERLEDYSSQIRGKEHDRLTGAFQRIGKELGFITQPELLQKGARVDVVWLNRQGDVEVAIEVETSAQWKKDIVSTWEAEPKLAIILSHAKTDKGAQEITQYVLLENMPHKLLFINYLLKKPT